MCAAYWRRGGAATRRVLLNDREGVANEREKERERERERESDAGGGAQAANDAAGATTRGWGSERCCGRYDARLGGGSDAEGAAGFDDEPGVCSRRWRECCRGAESERSAYDGGRARAADDAAGSDADEPVLRWRLAWPEARTADREVGGHTSREVDPKPMRGSRRGSERCSRADGARAESLSQRALSFDGAQDKECV